MELGVLSLGPTACLSFLFLCTVTDFSAGEKVRGMKFCMHVGLVSGEVFSPFGEHWLVGSHSRAGTLFPG